jgi:hypothetical protein
MGPGLPGLGIASIFYVVVALLAPLRELVLTVRGRSSLARWRLVTTQFLIAVGVVVALIGFYALLALMVSAGWIPPLRGPSNLVRIPNLMWGAFALVGVLGATTLYALWVRLTDEQESPEAIAAAHRSGVVDVVIDLREPSIAAAATSPPIPAPVRAVTAGEWFDGAPLWAPVLDGGAPSWSHLPRPTPLMDDPSPARPTAAASPPWVEVDWAELAASINHAERPDAPAAA